MRWRAGDTMAFNAVTKTGEMLRNAWDKKEAGDAYASGSEVTNPEDASVIEAYRDAATEQAGPTGEYDSYDFLPGGLGAKQPDQEQRTAAANSFSNAANIGTKYHIGRGDGREGTPYKDAPTPTQRHTGGLQRQIEHYSAVGDTDEAGKAMERLQSVTRNEQQDAMNKRVLARGEREDQDAQKIRDVYEAGQKRLEQIRRDFPDAPLAVAEYRNAVELSHAYKSIGKTEEGNKIEQQAKVAAATASLKAIEMKDWRTVEALFNVHPDGHKYTINGVAGADANGNAVLDVSVNGKRQQVGIDKIKDAIMSDVDVKAVYAAGNKADSIEAVTNRALILSLLRGGIGGRANAAGGTGARAASSKTGDGEQGGYLGIPGIKTQEDFDKFVNHSMGGPEGTPVVMDAKGKPVEGVNRQDYRERFSRIATDLATGGNNLPPGVLADVTHRMVRNGYAGGGIKQDIDVSKDGEARRVVTIDGRMYNLGGKLSDGEAIDFLERSYSGPPEQKAVAIEKFRVDKEYARATSTAKEFAVLDGGGSVADKNGTKLTKQAIINSMGGGEEGLQRYNEAKDAANTLAELATTKYQEFRDKHVDEGRRGGVKPNPASATTERNTGRRDTVWSPGGFPKIVPGVNGKADHIDWSPLTRRVEDKGYPQ